MSRFKLALFDFDGTLADSFPFFISVFNELAQQHGFRNIDLDKLENFRGYSVRQMMKYVGLSPWKLPTVARSFIGLMKENSDSIKLFDGVPDLLQRLSASGVTVAIVTSNSHENVCRILGPSNMQHVAYMECSSSIFSKAARIRRILDKSGISAEHAIYLGDQTADLKAARKSKIAFGAVSWGYSAMDVLRQHRPDYEISAMAEIAALIQTK